MSEYDFRGSPQAGDALFTRAVELNVTERLARACLRAGWYTVARYGQVWSGWAGTWNTAGVEWSGAAGDNPFTLLSRTKDHRYADGRVYQGRRKDWVWEGGLPQPVQPCAVAVTVNGAAASPATYLVDYPNGRVVFNAPLASGAVVRAEHAFRLVQVFDTSSPHFTQLDTLSLTPADDPRVAAPAGTGGDLEVAPDRRLQLPAVAVRPLYQFEHDPYETGGTALHVRQQVELTCLAEVPWHLHWLHDALTREADRPQPAFDPATAPPPYSADGSLKGGALQFEELTAAHPWRGLWVKKVRSGGSGGSGGVEWVKVIWTVEGQVF